MCSISGFNFSNRDLILKMNQITKHRGPDGSGIFIDDNISLGHNRLSIIDLSENASQPMISNDNKLVIVFNGEIYNFRELKRELEGFYNFKTESDTEVILASYQKWDRDCVKRFNGIFAFAVWDKNKKELFLARDHLGVKPLYYFFDGNNFIFSSEIKAILEHNIPRILDIKLFNKYLRTLYVPEPFTIFKNIYKFPAASYGILKGSNLEIVKYWELNDFKKFNKSKKEIAKELRARVIESVKRQLISDKPIGVFLSGGIDSTCVLHSISQARGNIDTFTIGFDLKQEEEREKFNRDFELARKTAKYYGTNHNEILISIDDVIDNFEKAIWHLDEPISNPTVISMFKLSHFTKNKGVDVVLGGDGGDELFGGYIRYKLSLISSYYQKIPFWVRKIFNCHKKIKKLDIPPNIERIVLFMFQKDEILTQVINKKYLDLFCLKDFFAQKYFYNFNLFNSFEEWFMNFDRLTWLKDESLARTDKMSMSAGLEARVPLLDRDLVEFAAKIPLKYKVNFFDTKIILKQAFRGLIPEFLYNKPKMGWTSPGAKWLRNKKFCEMAKFILSENYYNGTKNLFLWDNISKIFNDHIHKKKYNLTILWALLTFQVWARKYNIRFD